MEYNNKNKKEVSGEKKKKKKKKAVWLSLFLSALSLSHIVWSFSLSPSPSRVSHPLPVFLSLLSLSLADSSFSLDRFTIFLESTMMSDEGEKTCPLCAEEMDLTDQQLKPCKCGYEICVWCWHHIMDMAEKDDTDGRCPACRTPYDKERIVGTAANCERLVAEINMEKKQKSQKAKTKTSESRKQLSSVRVIQKNLVYIVGLPLNLADEDILQHKEYFSQYGKVLKVSISRTSAGTIQQFANNTCSVYITYSKEEEAVRCIQSVHGFILDGRPLRACFGTTKYCHAWLRNMPCSNPDCLYLHEIGSQEDSFTKDEIISAYTRVQQITGFANNMQRRSGNLLPPPADDYCNNNTPVIGKPVVKSSSNNSTNCGKGSPPTSSSGRSGALPPAASWGARASNVGNPPAGSLACSNGPTKQKTEIVSGSPPVSTTASIPQDSLSSGDGGKKLMSSEEIHSRQTTKNKLNMLDTSKHHTGLSSQTNASEVLTTSSGVSAVKSASHSPSSSVAANNTSDDHVLHNSTLSGGGRPCSPVADKTGSSIADEENQKFCSDLSLMSIENRMKDEVSDVIRPNGLCLDNFLSPGNQSSQLHDFEELQEHSTSIAVTSAVSAVDSVAASSDLCDWKSDIQALVTQNPTSDTEDDFDSQRLRDAIVVNQATMPSSSPLHFFGHLRGPSLQHVDAAAVVDYASNPSIVNRVPDEVLSSTVAGASNGFLDNFISHAAGHGNSPSMLDAGQGNQLRRFKSGLPMVDAVPSADMGESSIISNILDLDSWDDTLTSPQNLAKLLGENDKQEGPVKLESPWKGQISNQSRFSFARQEESRNHLYNFESSLSNIGQLAKNHNVGQAFVENRDLYLGRLGNGFGFPQGNIEQSENLTSGNSIFSSTSRSQISAPRPPPGFAAPSRPPPPPGFNLHERSDQTFDMKSGNHLLETSALLRSTYQSSPAGNMSTTSNDIEFLDPAILAVGKGRLPSNVNNSSIDMRSNYHVQNPTFENESRLLLMQRSLSPHQNLRYTDVRDNFSPVNDAYGFNTRHLEQSQQVSNLSPFSQFSLQQARSAVMSNGHWDNWNEISATNDSIADLLRNERLGFTKFGMTSSGDIYNRGFRM